MIQTHALKNHRDIFAGVFFVAVGGLWAAMALHYDMDKATHMGPGYFPLCASMVPMGIGCVLLLRGLRSREVAPLQRIRLVPLLFVIAAAAAFGLLIEPFGLIPASFSAVALSCYDRWRRRPIEALALCAGYTVMAVLIFYYGIHLPIQLMSYPEHGTGLF